MLNVMIRNIINFKYMKALLSFILVLIIGILFGMGKIFAAFGIMFIITACSILFTPDEGNNMNV